VRGIGAIAAADLLIDEGGGNRRLGYEVYQKAVKHGVLLRPLGNTIYWTPPLNTEREVLHKLQKITIKALNDCC
jgi:adenosylmethionine---8-amino-7-oxononanoate aminotransferase